MKTILTFDIGGSSMRTALFDLNGRLLGLNQNPLSMDIVAEGGCEADPDRWWSLFIELAADLVDGMKGQGISIEAVCGGGMTRCQIFLDENGIPLFPAILWPDNRSRQEAATLEKLAGREKRWSPINEYHTLSRVLWFKNNFSTQYNKTVAILEPKDYINFRLTGCKASDTISLSRILKPSNLALDNDLMEKAGIRPGLFPEIKWPWQLAGRCRAVPPRLDLLEDTPVFTGSMDTWCAVTGTGVSTGEIYNVSGTSEVTGLITREKIWRTGVVTLPWAKDVYQIGGPSQVGGDALKWLAEILIPDDKKGVETLARGAERHPRKTDVPLFIPYLRGERAPLWDGNARGVFWNMNREHTREDLTLAVMEGVGMANRYLLETIFEDAPVKGRVVISGGAAKSDLWCRIKANILGVPVVRKEAEEAGLMGAFLVAMAGLGRLDSIEQGQHRFVKTDRVFQPDTKMSKEFNRLYPHWRKASLAMLELHRDLQTEISTPLPEKA